MINPVNIHFKCIRLYFCKYIKYSHVYKSNKIIIILLDKNLYFREVVFDTKFTKMIEYYQ